MKKTLSLLLVLLCVLSLLLCGCSDASIQNDGRLTVLSTVFPPFDFSRAVGGERIDAQMLMSPGTDSHSYSGDNPTDILKISSCDVFIYIGGESENAWVEKVLGTIESTGGKTPHVICLSDHCELLEESQSFIFEEGAHSHEASHHGHDDGVDGHHSQKDGDSCHSNCAFDEHVWTSLDNAKRMVEAISDALCSVDPVGSDHYKKNAETTVLKLQDLDSEFKALFDGNEDNTLIFADRFPFAYFAHSYGLECYAAFSGCSSENEPSPTTVASLATMIEEKALDSIFYIETSKSNVPEALCRATGANAYLLHSCHTVTEKQLEDGVSYVSLMEGNLENLRKAFNDD